MGFRATWGAPAGRGSPTVTISPATTFSVGLNLNATLGGGAHTGLRWQRDDAYGLNPTPGTFADIGGAVAAPYTVQSADIGFGVRLAVDWTGGTVYSNTLRFAWANRAAFIEGYEFSSLPAGAVASLTGTKTGLVLTGTGAAVKGGTADLSFNNSILISATSPLLNGLSFIRVAPTPCSLTRSAPWDSAQVLHR